MISSIDISPLFYPESTKQYTDLVTEIDAAIFHAASDIGFLTVSGLPDDCLSIDTQKKLLEIFDMEDKEIRKLYRANFLEGQPNIYRGWFPVQSGVPTYKEGIDIGPDLAYGTERFIPDDPLTEMTPMPSEHILPGWRALAKNYYLTMEKVAEAIMHSCARSLGLEQNYFDPYFTKSISTLRFLHYPVRPPESYGQDKASLTLQYKGKEFYLLGKSHVDSSFITLLAQHGIPGLQAQTHSGEWIDIPPDEGKMAVNFGKLLEKWTGGLIKATHHRIIGDNQDRCSIPFFYEASVDATIKPIKDLSDDFDPFLYGNYLWDVTTNFVEQKNIRHLRNPRDL